VLLGKAIWTSSAMGSSTRLRFFARRAQNPWISTVCPGGSKRRTRRPSAQNFAAVFAGAPTRGGSIRQAAALWAWSDSSRTYGRVSRYGLNAFASFADQIGPFSRTVETGARVNAIVVRPLPTRTRWPRPFRYTPPHFLLSRRSGVRLALRASNFSVEAWNSGVESSVKARDSHLESLGRARRVSLPAHPVGLAPTT